MPIDASIYDRLIQPLQKPESPLAIMQGVANLRDTQALAEDRRSLVQEKIRQAQENGQIQQVMADQTSDMPTKIQRLYAINPKTAGEVQQSWDTSQKNHVDLVKTIGDNAARALALYDPKNPQSWDHARAVASATYQQAGQPVPQEYQDPTPPSQDTVDRWMMSKASLDEQIKAKQKHFESKEVLGPDGKTVTLQNFDPSTGQVAPVTDAQGQSVVSPKTAELANTAATQARLEQHQTTQEGMERQRLGLEGARVGMERQRLQREAAGGATPNQPPSDAVLGYRDDIISGASKLTDVPAAGGMRNSVVAQLRKEGYDLNKPLTAQAQARVDLAKLVLPQVGEVRDMAKKIDAMGLMGTMGGRWRSLTAGESAADAIAGLTPAQRQLIGQFVAQADLLSSGTAMTHFGARAGGAAVDAMRQQLDPKNKSLDVYLGNLEAASNVLGGYAKGLPGATKHGETQGETPAPVSAGTSATVRMRAPNGQMKDVPADRVDFYKSKGAVVVK